MKNVILILSLIVVILSACNSKNNKDEGGPAAAPTTDGLIHTMIIKVENGKLKLFKGMKSPKCGNPSYNEKDSVKVSKDFLLTVDSAQVIHF